MPRSSPLPPPPPLADVDRERATARLSLTGEGAVTEIPIGETQAGRAERISVSNRRGIAALWAVVWAVVWPMADRSAAEEARRARWGGHRTWAGTMPSAGDVTLPTL